MIFNCKYCDIEMLDGIKTRGCIYPSKDIFNYYYQCIKCDSRYWTNVNNNFISVEDIKSKILKIVVRINYKEKTTTLINRGFFPDIEYNYILDNITPNNIDNKLKILLAFQ